jgi:hypothetical protein
MTVTNDQGARAPRSGRAGRVAALIGAAVAGLLAVTLFAGGGLLLWADSKKDDDGFLMTKREGVTTKTAALSTSNLDADLGGAGSVLGDNVYGDVRVRASSDDGKPLFVGIAPTAAVKRYLAGASHEVIDELELDPFAYDSHVVTGTARSLPSPAGNRIWAASSTGPGTQTMSWDVRDGDWSVVVMNADGTPGVNASVSAGASLGFLDDAGRIAIASGVVLLVIAGALLVAGVRRRPAPSAPLGRASDASVAVA